MCMFSVEIHSHMWPTYNNKIFFPWDSVSETKQMHIDAIICVCEYACMSVNLSTCMHHYLVTLTLTGDQCRHTMQNKLSTPLGLNKWLILSPHLNVQQKSTKVSCLLSFQHYQQKKYISRRQHQKNKKKQNKTQRETALKINRDWRKDEGQVQMHRTQERTSIQITVKRTRLTLMSQPGVE